MSSDKQIAANIRNAQLSTGPCTPAGKAKVSMNALKHGLTGRNIILPTENLEEFESFYTGLLNCLAPEGALEMAFAEKIATDMWRQRRVPMFEAAFYDRGLLEITAQREEATCSSFEKTTETILFPLDKREVAECDREAHADAQKRLKSARFRLNEPSFDMTRVQGKFAKLFISLSRHEIALSHSITKSLHELERLQAARRGQHVAAPSVVDVNINLPDRLPVDGQEKDESDRE
jgi:hypothetical protein